MDRQYVGIDFHRRRSVIVRKNAAGEKLGSVRVANDALSIGAAIADAGPNPEVVIEATYGWYWIVDWLHEQGATVHLANPSGLNWGQRRVKNDERDAIDLIDMLRLGSSAGGVDRATGNERVARAGPLSRQVGGVALGAQSAGARGDGQRGCAPERDGSVRSRRQR